MVRNFESAYNVELYIIDNDTILPLITDTTRLNRIYFHKRGYVILENMQGKMKDYHYKFDSTLLFMENIKEEMFWNYKIEEKKSLKLLKRVGEKQLFIYCKALDLSKLKIKKDDFHFSIDGYN